MSVMNFCLFTLGGFLICRLFLQPDYPFGYMRRKPLIAYWGYLIITAFGLVFEWGWYLAVILYLVGKFHI